MKGAAGHVVARSPFHSNYKSKKGSVANDAING
jgi:hypothetical protein